MLGQNTEAQSKKRDSGQGGDSAAEQRCVVQRARGRDAPCGGRRLLDDREEEGDDPRDQPDDEPEFEADDAEADTRQHADDERDEHLAAQERAKYLVGFLRQRKYGLLLALRHERPQVRHDQVPVAQLACNLVGKLDL